MDRDASSIGESQLSSTTVTRASRPFRLLVAGIRIALGWVFLWAFLDKTFGLGYATPASRAWINGGSPTVGYLANATYGPFGGLFQAMAGHPLVDVLFMLGLLGVGVALILGAGMRLASLAGSLMLLLMWLSALPPANNPVIDDHIVYPLVLWLLPLVRAGEVYGIGRWWKRQPIVQRFPILA